MICRAPHLQHIEINVDLKSEFFTNLNRLTVLITILTWRIFLLTGIASPIFMNSGPSMAMLCRWVRLPKFVKGKPVLTRQQSITVKKPTTNFLKIIYFIGFR